MLKRLRIGASIAPLLLAIAGPAHAAELTITITNLTNGIYYTPFLVAAHTEDSRIFRSGEAASPSLQAMAEGGDIAGLVTDLTGIGATLVENPAGGLLAPTESTTTTMNTDGTDNVRLSVVAMLLPTNDAFMGLNGILIPSEPGTYTYNVNAYDAGTEANDEIVNGGGAPGVPGIPAAPGGSGTGATGAAGPDNNQTVHIHRNTLGDLDNVGGVSDLDSRIHRWLNPVARVTVVVE